MRPQTRQVGMDVRSLSTPEDQLAALADRYRGDTAYILASGPSLGEVWSPRFEEYLRDKLVIAVKGTYNLCPDSVDFHIFNRCRHITYQYPAEPPVRMSIEVTPFEQEVDIRLPFWYHQEQRWLHSVLFSRAFDRWDLARGAARGWGPGILLELGVFLPIHLGCSHMVFIGWDMNPVEPVHFEEAEITQKQLEEHVVVSNCLPQFIPHLVKWWASRGAHAVLCSPRSSVPLPQLTPEEVMRRG